MKAYKDLAGTIPAKEGDGVARMDCGGEPLLQQIRESQPEFMRAIFPPTPAMVRAAEEAYTPFGDMELALTVAMLEGRK